MICILLLYIIFFSIPFLTLGMQIVLKLSMLRILRHRDLVPSALVHTWIKATFWKSNYYCGWVALSVIKWILIFSIVVVQCRPVSSNVVSRTMTKYAIILILKWIKGIAELLRVNWWITKLFSEGKKLAVKIFNFH